MSEYIDFPALGQVLLAAAVGGIGLVALFALGLRGVSWKVDDGKGSGVAVATASFGLVAAGVVFGIYTLFTAA